MNPLPEELRARLRAWADRPPARSAAAAAARARQAAPSPRPVRWRRLAWGTAAVAAFATVLLLPAALRRDEPRPLAPPPSAAAAAPPTAPRVVLVELASGTPLYVTLPPAPPAWSSP